MQNNKLRTTIVHSNSYDPWYNLALEEYLFNGVSKEEAILYLWQNKDTVVIGKHQNPWKECKCRKLEEDGGKLARRLSGGGAVYHDIGNLNFTFIMNKDIYNGERQLKIILNALRELGVNAEFSGRNDIIVEGKKCSGNAFYSDGVNSLHHGTLLIKSDINKLTKYLQVSKDKMESKGIDSVRARVVNLIEVNNDITISKIIKSIEKNFLEEYSNDFKKYFFKDIFDSKIEKMYNKYSSWSWRYGETPEFDISLYNRFSWGSIDIGLKLKDGIIIDSRVYSDAIDSDFIERLSKSISERSFTKESLIKSLDDSISDYTNIDIVYDIKNWIFFKDI